MDSHKNSNVDSSSQESASNMTSNSQATTDLIQPGPSSNSQDLLSCSEETNPYTGNSNFLPKPREEFDRPTSGHPLSRPKMKNFARKRTGLHTPIKTITIEIPMRKKTRIKRRRSKPKTATSPTSTPSSSSSSSTPPKKKKRRARKSVQKRPMLDKSADSKSQAIPVRGSSESSPEVDKNKKPVNKSDKPAESNKRGRGRRGRK